MSVSGKAPPNKGKGNLRGSITPAQPAAAAVPASGAVAAPATPTGGGRTPRQSDVTEGGGKVGAPKQVAAAAEAQSQTSTESSGSTEQQTDETTGGDGTRRRRGVKLVLRHPLSGGSRPRRPERRTPSRGLRCWERDMTSAPMQRLRRVGVKNILPGWPAFSEQCCEDHIALPTCLVDCTTCSAAHVRHTGSPPPRPRTVITPCLPTSYKARLAKLIESAKNSRARQFFSSSGNNSKGRISSKVRSSVRSVSSLKGDEKKISSEEGVEKAEKKGDQTKRKAKKKKKKRKKHEEK